MRRRDIRKRRASGKSRIGYAKWKRGSLTLEASICLPIVVLFFVSLFGLLYLIEAQAKSTVELQEKAELAAQLMSGNGKEGNGIIDLHGNVNGEIKGLVFRGLSAASRGRVRAWIGKKADSESKNGASEEMLFVSEHESVAHTDSGCTHLQLEIRTAGYSEIKELKNIDGKHYQPCEKCVGGGAPAHTVFVGTRGEKFHHRGDCSGLTRTVRIIRKSEAKGLSLCTRCGAA